MDHGAASPERKLRVFLSYSRKDGDFVRRLAGALETLGYLADFDQSDHHVESGETGIAPTDDWWLRLQDMIAAADVMALVVSPYSAASNVVDEEIAYARSLSKRIVAISCREVDFASAPPRLSALNVNHWFLQQDFQVALDALCKALDRDVEWLRASARYTVDAKAWQDATKTGDKLLFGADIAAAEAWSARRPASAPEVSELVLMFLDASRAAQTRRDKNQRAIRRVITALTATAFVITMAGAWFVVNGQRNLARSRSQMIAMSAETMYKSGDYLRAVRLSLVASRDSFLSPAWPKASAMLASSAQTLKLRAEFRGHGGVIHGAIFSKDRSKVLTWSEDKTARLWNAETGEEIIPPLKHKDQLNGATFSPDETRIMTWSKDHTVRQWDLRTGREIGSTLTLSDAVVGASYFKNGSRILTASFDDAVRIWDANGGRTKPWELKYELGLSGLALSHDESKLLSWSNAYAVISDAETGEMLAPSLIHDDRITGASFDATATKVITWSKDETARVWDAKSGEQIGPSLKHNGEVTGGAFSSDGKRVLTSSLDGTARIWDATTGETLFPLEHGDSLFGAMFDSTGTSILTLSVGAARIWDANTGEAIGSALEHGAPLLGAVFSNYGSKILTWDVDGAARVWSSKTGKQLGPPLKDDGAILGAIFSSDDSSILTWTVDGVARRWDAQTSGRVGPTIEVALSKGASYSHNEARILAWGLSRPWLFDAKTGDEVAKDIDRYSDANAGGLLSEDDRRLLVWGVYKQEATARVLDPNTFEQLGPTITHDERVTGAVFSADEKRILTWSEDNTARQSSSTTGLQIARIMQHSDSVQGAAYLKRDTRILSWSADGLARLWSAETGAQIAATYEHDSSRNEPVSSPDGAQFLTWNGKVAKIWNSGSGAQIGRDLNNKGEIWGAAISNDQSKIVTWGEGPFIQLWNAQTGVSIGHGLQYKIDIEGAQFSKDTKHILTIGDDGTLRVWSTKSGLQVGAPMEHESVIRGVVFSSDETRILTFGGGGARIWDAKLHTQIGLPLEVDDENIVMISAASQKMKRVFLLSVLTLSSNGMSRWQ